MKRIFGFTLMVAMMAAPAFGSSSNKPQTLIVPQKVQVGSTQLPAGSYKISYTGTGSAVQVTVTQGKKTVLTCPAKVIAGKNIQGVTTEMRGTVNTLVSIQLDNVSLELEGATQAGE